MPEHSHRPTNSTSSTSGAAEIDTGNAEVDAQDLVGNQGVQEEIDPTYTGIVLVGLGTYAHDEASRLNAANRDDGGAKSVRQRGHEQDVLTRGGRKFDLAKSEDVEAFVALIGLPAAQAEAAGKILNGAGNMAKDEMGQLIEVYAQAESGVRNMDRLVLSGHSVGDQIWGDDNGWIQFSEFEDLKNVFPKAAAQVKHLMVSACYAGGEANMAKFHAAFPSLDSIWAYTGSSPGTWSGAMVHMDQWEAATEHDQDGSKVDPEAAGNSRKAENIATWNSTDGYQGESPMDLSTVESELTSQESTYQRFFSGEEAVANSQAGPLRDYYNLVQRALQHPDLASGRRAELEKRRDVTIRLLYWSVVAGKFASHYNGQVSQGYATVSGLSQPDWGKLGRAEAIASIQAFAGVASDAAAQTALDLLQRGLINLDNDVIPTSWV